MANEIAQSQDNWALLQRQCKAFLESGYLPNNIKTIAQALTIAWKGHELGIPPLTAFSLISVVNGKPVVQTELALALVYKRVPGAQITVLTPPEEQHMQCTVEAKRPNGKAQIFKFTLDDAEKAGLLGRQNWMHYPPDMLRARAISRAIKVVFPDALIGRHQVSTTDISEDILDAELIEPAPAELKQIEPTSEEEKAAQAVDKLVAAEKGP